MAAVDGRRQSEPDLLLRRVLAALADETTIDPDTVERLLETQPDGARRKRLAVGLRAAGLAEDDAVALAFHRWPDLRDA
jgi:hypothetical protein